jgi:hypothetical protein
MLSLGSADETLVPERGLPGGCTKYIDDDTVTGLHAYLSIAVVTNEQHVVLTPAELVV